MWLCAVCLCLMVAFQVVSAPFEVVLGAPFNTRMITQPGTATGGRDFSPQPVLSVIDKGGNTITSLSSGDTYLYQCLLNGPIMISLVV
jgi:hypothetical protein